MFPEQLLPGVTAPGRAALVHTGWHELEEPAAAGEGGGGGGRAPFSFPAVVVSGKVPSKTPCRPDGGPPRPPPSRGSESTVSASPQP